MFDWSKTLKILLKAFFAQGDGVGDDAGGGPDSGTAFTWVKS